MLNSTDTSTSTRKHSFHKKIIYPVLVLVGAGGALLGQHWLSFEALSQPAEVTSQPNASDGLSSRLLAGNTNSNFIAEAVQEVGSAVVRIDASRTVQAQTPNGLTDPFERFFGSDAPVQPQPHVQEGVGSGFIVDSAGVVLTNAHVVDGADQVTVTLKDGRTFNGKVLGEDRVTDVAVVKIEAQDLPTVPLGNSDQLQPGEWAIAIGNPLGLDNTVTVGIISATGRSSAQVGIPDQRGSFIQTDAAINPGNSGGPLLNQQGQVVGMNTAIRANAQGLGFAIPINTAKRIADQLIATGRVDHPYLGVQMTTLTPQLKQRLENEPNLPFTVQDETGILVLRVVPNSPAAAAGVQPGDVITKLNNQVVTTSEQVQETVENSRIGNDLSVELRRQGQVVNLSIQPVAFPNESQG
ncbi:MAG: HhoA/HhoB/HtrA family serine endopeptidase [Oculatellaceae cyanobacterium bins.114]|nr:HhoA/HhoB/HtrA family serine endopeptidase [Oculatellaceae cyanobacterium bins.114]